MRGHRAVKPRLLPALSPALCRRCPSPSCSLPFWNRQEPLPASPACPPSLLAPFTLLVSPPSLRTGWKRLLPSPLPPHRILSSGERAALAQHPQALFLLGTHSRRLCPQKWGFLAVASTPLQWHFCGWAYGSSFALLLFFRS